MSVKSRGYIQTAAIALLTAVLVALAALNLTAGAGHDSNYAAPGFVSGRIDPPAPCEVSLGKSGTFRAAAYGDPEILLFYSEYKLFAAEALSRAYEAREEPNEPGDYVRFGFDGFKPAALFGASGSVPDFDDMKISLVAGGGCSLRLNTRDGERVYLSPLSFPEIDETRLRNAERLPDGTLIVDFAEYPALELSAPMTDDASISPILTAFGVNINSALRYTDAQGARVVSDAGRVVKIGADGSVLFRDENGLPCAVSPEVAALSVIPAGAVSGGYCEYEQTSRDGAFVTVRLKYMYNGAAIEFAPAEFTFKSNRLVEAAFTPAAFREVPGKRETLMPQRSAAALTGGKLKLVISNEDGLWLPRWSESPD